MSVLRSRLRGAPALSLLVMLVATLAACRVETVPRAADSARTVRDDFGDTLVVGEEPPRRIVSLNPATTEILFALGAGGRLVGRTHWDVHPDSARLVPDLGDGMRPNVEAVLAARPDLVVLYASADNRDAARALHDAGVATLTLRVDRIEQFARATLSLGRVIGDTARARVVVDTVERTLDRVSGETSMLPHPRVFWKAWDAPLMAIGGGSFMTELLSIAGARNVYADLPDPSPQVTIEDVVRRDPDLVVAGANSAATLRTTPAWRALRAVREGRIVVVDTSLVAFPSVRLGEAATTLARALHPELR
jgi:ABC-type Fe3+-hydroxamate transport system substrate-binding protein